MVSKSTMIHLMNCLYGKTKADRTGHFFHKILINSLTSDFP